MRIPIQTEDGLVRTLAGRRSCLITPYYPCLPGFMVRVLHYHGSHVVMEENLNVRAVAVGPLNAILKVHGEFSHVVEDMLHRSIVDNEPLSVPQALRIAMEEWTFTSQNENDKFSAIYFH